MSSRNIFLNGSNNLANFWWKEQGSTMTSVGFFCKESLCIICCSERQVTCLNSRVLQLLSAHIIYSNKPLRMSKCSTLLLCFDKTVIESSFDVERVYFVSQVLHQGNTKKETKAGTWRPDLKQSAEHCFLICFICHTHAPS